MKSRVYYVKTKDSSIGSRSQALEKILESTADFLAYQKAEIVPVKITIGDAACVYNLSPALVSAVIARIKKGGAKPFLFDTCVIYEGKRQNAVDHLALAQSKGFSYDKVGAPFIVADGLLGNDGKEFSLSSPDIQKVKVPSFVGMLNSLLVLSHPTGHIVSGFAGAIKNVAMGMSSKAAKQVQHSSLRPAVISKKCTACGYCIAICPAQAISLKAEKASIDQLRCLGCGECLCACRFDAVYINWEEDPHVFCRRMAEVANAILREFKRKFFISFAFDITQECDCISAQGEKMASGDFGILASHDVLSLDKATADLACAHKKTDFFLKTRKIPDAMFDYAQRIGLGSLEYDLIELDPA